MTLFKHDLWRACFRGDTPRASNDEPWQGNYAPYTDLYSTVLFPYTDWLTQTSYGSDYQIVKVNVGDSSLPVPGASFATKLLSLQYGPQWRTPKRNTKFEGQLPTRTKIKDSRLWSKWIAGMFVG